MKSPKMNVNKARFPKMCEKGLKEQLKVLLKERQIEAVKLQMMQIDPRFCKTQPRAEI
jgi:hypothetical protein